MQPCKPFNFDDNSVFTDQLLQDDSPQALSASQREDALMGHLVPPQQQRNILNSINSVRFFQQYKKIYSVSYHLHLEKRRLLHLLRRTNKRVGIIQDRLRDSQEKDLRKTENSSEDNRVKRSRRTAELIEKKFQCNVAFCQRFYGSEGSLQQHIKLKHPELYRAPDSSASENASNSL